MTLVGVGRWRPTEAERGEGNERVARRGPREGEGGGGRGVARIASVEVAGSLTGEGGTHPN